MNQKEIKHTQGVVGTKQDGDWGRLSNAAARRYLIKVAGSARSRFPTQAKVRTGRSVYGARGYKDGFSPPTRSIRLPFALHLYGDSSDLVRTLSPHEVCADAFLAAFQRLAVAYPTKEARKAAGILDYFGIYNPRATRGGTADSMHAYTCAIDLDANRNRNRSHWPVASKMPIEVMACFAAEGILSAGAFWNRDGMHHQATAF